MCFTAIMRSFSLLQEAIVPYIPTLIGQLTQKLLLVSKVWKAHAYIARIQRLPKTGLKKFTVSSLTDPVSSHGNGHTDRTQINNRPVKGTFPKGDLVLKAGWDIHLKDFNICQKGK